MGRSTAALRAIFAPTASPPPIKNTATWCMETGHADHTRPSAPVCRLFDEDESLQCDDYNMTVAQYNANKHDIRKHLCNRGDAKAALVRPGNWPPDLAPRAIGERLKQLNDDGNAGYSIVRGYRLVSMTTANSRMRTTYNAQSHIVIRSPNGDYESLTRNTTKSNPDAPYVFVPSSRMHTDMDDEELLSGYWLLCTVVGGPPEITGTLIRLRDNMCDFERRRLCSSPEDSRARRSLAIRQFPGYAKWARLVSKLPESVYVDSAIAFGMPSRDLTDEEMDMVFAGENIRTMMEIGDASEFLHPKEPWKFEKERWLPSVETLHVYVDRYSKMVYYTCGGGVVEDVFFPIYDQLQTEYAMRLTNCEQKFKTERRSMYEEDFR